MRYKRWKNIHNKGDLFFAIFYILFNIFIICALIHILKSLGLIGLCFLAPFCMNLAVLGLIFESFKRRNPFLFDKIKCGKCGKKIRSWNGLYIISQIPGVMWTEVPPSDWIFCEKCHSIEKLKE